MFCSGVFTMTHYHFHTSAYFYHYYSYSHTCYFSYFYHYTYSFVLLLLLLLHIPVLLFFLLLLIIFLLLLILPLFLPSPPSLTSSLKILTTTSITYPLLCLCLLQPAYFYNYMSSEWRKSVTLNKKTKFRPNYNTCTSITLLCRVNLLFFFQTESIKAKWTWCRAGWYLVWHHHLVAYQEVPPGFSHFFKTVILLWKFLAASIKKLLIFLNNFLTYV